MRPTQHRPFRQTQLAAAIGALTLVLAAGQAQGAAFALQEQSGSGLGNAYAGGAAAAEDATTVWSNPAGMARMSSTSIAIAGSLISPSIKFRNDGSLPALNQPLGGDGGNAADMAFVPAMYAAIPINKDFAIGIGVGAPFGLKTEWDDGWLGRYQGLLSDLKTLNINPALSWRVNDRFSLGVGLNYQHIDATLTNNFNYSAAMASAAGQAAASGAIPASLVPTIVGATGGLDSKVTVDGSDYTWGWNIGVLFDLDSNTRIGAHYRSSLKYDVVGNVNFAPPALPTLPPALAPVVALLANQVNANPALANGGVTSSIELPAIANVSIFSKLDAKWDVMADAQWTQWSTIPDLTFVRTTGATLASTPENFKDAWRVSAGANYYLNDQWKLRGGIAFDQSPVQDAERTPRLPDADRYWVTTGAQYNFNKNMKFDLGVAYIWATDAPSQNQNAGNTQLNGLIKGSYDASVLVVSGQFTYTY